MTKNHKQNGHAHPTAIVAQPADNSILPPWVAKMRQAAMNAITEDDITAIVQAQVERAKKGDPNALKFVFDQVLGGAQLKGATFVQNNYAAGAKPVETPAKDARPGTDDKLDLMAKRAAARQPLCVDGDGVEDDDEEA